MMYVLQTNLSLGIITPREYASVLSASHAMAPSSVKHAIPFRTSFKTVLLQPNITQTF